MSRVAKSAYKWAMSDLKLYNIKLVHQNSTEFFGTQHLPRPRISREILNCRDASEATIIRNRELLNLLHLAASTEESSVDDFAIALFHMLGYVEGSRVARARKIIRLPVCGELRYSTVDVGIFDCHQNNVILMAQESKRSSAGPTGRDNAQAQLVTEGIGAFCWNNIQRQKIGQPQLDSQIIPGITMIGTMPTFFKMPITRQLQAAVDHGVFPEQQTRIFTHFPDVPRPNSRWAEGMKPLDNRQHILNCFEAFKGVVSIR